MSVRRGLAAILVAGLLLATAGCDPQTATAPMGDLSLVAHFADVQDLTRGHTVQVANVVVGSVTEVTLDGNRAKVTMSIVDDQEIPADTRAVVRRTSLLGEYFVDLVFPEGSGGAGPFLASGDEIAETETERDVEQLAEQAAVVIGSIAGDDIAGVIDAGADAIGGRGTTINEAVDHAGEVLAVLGDQSQQLGSAIDDFGAIGAALAPASDDIALLIEQLATATANAAGSRDRMVLAVEALVDLATAINSVVLIPHADRIARSLEELVPLLGALTDRTDVLADLIVDLRAFTDVLPTAVHSGQILLLAWAYIDPAVLGLSG